MPHVVALLERDRPENIDPTMRTFDESVRDNFEVSGRKVRGAYCAPGASMTGGLSIAFSAGADGTTTEAERVIEPRAEDHLRLNGFAR